MYHLLRNILFLFDAEKVHHFSMFLLKICCKWPLTRKLLAALLQPQNAVEQTLWNIPFPNPVGLAAGFDKNASYLKELETLGFGFVEIGTVTPLPQDGNTLPRLFRLPKDKALINRMGFNNEGVKAIVKKLKDWKVAQELKGKLHQKKIRMIVGGNIGKNKLTPNEEAWRDYETCFRELFEYVDYFVVNVSSPNTPGLRELQEKEALQKILSHLQTINKQQPRPKPLLLKIAPDLTLSQIDDVIALCMEIQLDGLVAANTTISRDGLITKKAVVKETGGLSGLPLKKRATEMVKYISQKTNGKMPVIASGGIFTGEDASEKIAAGASLVQVWTGFIYEGPAIVKKICAGLQKKQSLK